MSSFFPKDVPKNMTLRQHDFTEPWPQDLHGKFDLVHQRAALAGARTASVEAAVKQLPVLLKPGGWLQLMEMDLSQYDDTGAATAELYRGITQLMELGGSGTPMSKPGMMVKWLKEAGLEDVREKIFKIPAGQSCEDAEMKEISAKHLSHTAGAVLGGLKAMGGKVAEDLPERYEKELREQGGTFDLICAMGRKPL